MRAVAIATGGALGALVRWQLVELWTPVDTFAWSVWVCNVVGSALLGAALAEEWRHPAHRRFWHAGVAIGFCGGLTTMSTFALDIVDHGRSGDATTAAVYAATSVAVCLAAVLAGAAAMGRIRSLTEQVEDRW